MPGAPQEKKSDAKIDHSPIREEELAGLPPEIAQAIRDIRDQMPYCFLRDQIAKLKSPDDTVTEKEKDDIKRLIKERDWACPGNT